MKLRWVAKRKVKDMKKKGWSLFMGTKYDYFVSTPNFLNKKPVKLFLMGFSAKVSKSIPLKRGRHKLVIS